MSFNLSKGSSFNLTKAAPELKIAGIGLGWNANESEDGPIFDLDVSAFLLDSTGQISDPGNFVFYGSALTTVYGDEDEPRPYSLDGSVLGAIDEQEGGGDDDDDETGDEEDMRVFFDRVSADIEEVVIVVSITKYPHDSKKDKRTLDLNFGQVDGCYIRVWNEENQEELFRYTLSENFGEQDAVEFGRFQRSGGEWNFKAVGSPHIGGLHFFIGQFAKNF
jgi:tellurium resistance protein TerD